MQGNTKIIEQTLGVNETFAKNQQKFLSPYPVSQKKFS